MSKAVAEIAALGVVQAREALTLALELDVPPTIRGRIADDLTVFTEIYALARFGRQIDPEHAEELAFEEVAESQILSAELAARGIEPPF